MRKALSFDEGIKRLNEVIRAWVNHYRMANTYQKLGKVEGWLRNRLRYCIWHHWPNVEKIVQWTILVNEPAGGRRT
ncbi:group II intron maturase-specific domain-containing protein [Cryomorpha ignava]|uniref:group II intron maturase-specific domain-containing protein n=1 Tax=Cryomorpha ignava TaxID=101383 RepID=UPI00293BD79A|nr:group II intron maturase-specific domain-containing protein [Cryomorpha ignava]